MNEQELREKIIRIVLDVPITGIKIREMLGGEATANNIAEALIAADIGDVSKLKNHRVIAEYSLVPDDDNPYIIPNVPLRVTQLYSGEEVEQIVKERDEYKHRAEVAERALRNAAPRLNCRGGLGKGFCRVDKCDYYHCNNDEGCVRAHLQQAEKELKEKVK